MYESLLPQVKQIKGLLAGRVDVPRYQPEHLVTVKAGAQNLVKYMTSWTTADQSCSWTAKIIKVKRYSQEEVSDGWHLKLQSKKLLQGQKA